MKMEFNNLRIRKSHLWTSASLFWYLVNNTEPTSTKVKRCLASTHSSGFGFSLVNKTSVDVFFQASNNSISNVGNAFQADLLFFKQNY